MSAPRKRPDWSRRLPRPLIVADLTTLTTLADVRDLIERHLPVPYREKVTWKYVAARLGEAARDGDAAEVVVPLRMALALEGVPTTYADDVTSQ